MHLLNPKLNFVQTNHNIDKSNAIPCAFVARSINEINRTN